jgi:hypothetical protein
MSDISRIPTSDGSTKGAPIFLGNTDDFSVPNTAPDESDLGLRLAWKRELLRLKHGANHILDNSYLRKCGRVLLPPEKNPARIVLVFRTLGNIPILRGLIRCGSVWGCPTCAAKITEFRRKELREAIDKAKAIGWKIHLLTLTFPHASFEHPKDLRKKFQKALEIFRNRKTWRKWRTSIGLEGYVTGLEVRHGENGWHIHQHILLFVDPIGSIEPQDNQILPAYQSACVKAGLRAPDNHGVDIRGGDLASDYVAKYGLEFEVTKSHIKRGKNGSRSPWDLLRDWCDGQKLDTAERDGPAGEALAETGRLFREYYEAFKGQKQLNWSRGLRDMLGLVREKSDEEIAEIEEGPEREFIGSLNRSQWRIVLQFRLVSELLESVAFHGVEGFRIFKLKHFHNEGRGS